jgi:hypothetical protein
MSKYGEQNEAMKFYNKSRPNPEVERKLQTRDTDYGKIDFPQHKDTEYSNYEEFLASDEYENALQKLIQYTGISDVGTGASGKFYELSSKAFQIMKEIMTLESGKKDELEELAEKVLREYFGIPKEALVIELKLNRESIKIDDEPGELELQKREEELAQNFVNLDQERIQRRLQNAMTHGLSVDRHWIFENSKDELIRLTGDDKIIEKYGIFTSISLFGYWQMSEEQMGIQESLMSINEATAGGKSGFTTREKPPKVWAEALVFPFLIHEGLKAIMSYLGDKRKPEHKPTYIEAKRLEDTLKAETWDIRLGPAIWRKFYSKLPLSLRTEDDKRKFIFYLVSNVANLPTKEYLILYKEIFSDSKESKKLMSALYYDMSRLRSEDKVTEEESEFKKIIKELSDKTSDNDINDMLAGLGIGLSK